jgi:ATP-dependent 26S proteasome regulatory subunit
MDDATFLGLQEALRASPDNGPLRSMLLRACVDRGDDEEGLALAADATASSLTEDGQRAAAHLLLADDQGTKALGVLEGAGEPASHLMRARVLLALDRPDDGRKAYELAVEGNSTLENPELASALSPRASASLSRGDGRLRVVASHDEPDETVERLLAPPLERITFADVGGLDHVKKAIRRRIITPFEKPSLFERFRRKIGGGVLMYGPPGCGKTMLARATAGEANATFINVAISDVLDMYIGESERKLSAIFDRARQSTPAVLFFDELEALAGNRKYGRDSNTGKLVSLFLSEMDGFANDNQGVLLVGATNVPWTIDPAFQRPGRFDRVLFVPPPDADARRTILGRLLEQRPTEGTMPLDALVRATNGFSGADLANLVESAVDEAIDESLERGEEVSLTAGHLTTAQRDLRPTTHEWLTTARNHARYANEGGRYDEVLAFLEKHGKRR